MGDILPYSRWWQVLNLPVPRCKLKTCHHQHRNENRRQAQRIHVGIDHPRRNCQVQVVKEIGKEPDQALENHGDEGTSDADWNGQAGYPDSLGLMYQTITFSV